MRRIAILLILAFLVPSLGCAARQARKAGESGFLGDYSELQKGGPNEPLLYYERPDANLSRFAKLEIEPVTAWTDSDGLKNVPEDELEALLNYMDTRLREVLGQSWTLVERSGPRTLRLRVAITEVDGANFMMKSVSSVLPQALILGGAAELASGTRGFVGKAAIEAELVNSLTGKRYVAGVDKRQGARGVAGPGSTWNDAKAAIDFWVDEFAKRLQELRNKS
jgi:hypothetical protein